MQLRAGGREHQGTAQRGAAVPSAVTETWVSRSGEPSPELAGESGGEEQVAGGHEEGGCLSCPAPHGEPPVSLQWKMILVGALRSVGLSGACGAIYSLGATGRESCQLGQFAEHFYLYEISLWLPEGKEISFPNGSPKATRRGAL